MPDVVNKSGENGILFDVDNYLSKRLIHVLNRYEIGHLSLFND